MDKSNLTEGKDFQIKKIDNNTIVATVQEEKKTAFEQAMYDFNSREHIYNRYLKSDNMSFVTSIEEINSLSINPQNNLDKIKKINNIVKYYINKDDLAGKVCEALENNVNTEYKIDFPNIPKGRNKLKVKEKADILIKSFNEKIDVEKMIIKSDLSTYTEGTVVTYLRDTKDGGYNITFYPLGVVEISDYELDGEPVVLFNVQELKSRLSDNQNIFKSMKTKNNFPKTIDEEIKRNYPSEIYEAYINKDKYAILNPKRVGVMRINNFNELYGLTPIFKSIGSQLMLETIDTVDKKNTIEKGKKIIVQILRKELLGQDGKNTQHFDELNYAHTNLLMALSKNTVVASCPAYVEKIEILESKQQPTNIDTILYYRNKVLNSLGINFLSNETKSSFNSVNVNVGELLKTINKITAQFEKILNKYYKTICEQNNIPLEFCPKINILPTEMMDTETKLKFVDMLYSKIGGSYRSIFELLGMDFETELQRRIEENEYTTENGDVQGLDSIFIPHGSSYTANSNELVGEKTDKTEVNQNQDKDKQKQDKDRYSNS